MTEIRITQINRGWYCASFVGTTLTHLGPRFETKEAAEYWLASVRS